MLDTMKTYIRIKDCEHGEPLILELQEAKKIIDEMVDQIGNGSEDVKYSFEAIEMKQSKFAAMPMFPGF